eukprot:1153363-Pelagomonas_calceolata.AAC.4
MDKGSQGNRGKARSPGKEQRRTKNKNATPKPIPTSIRESSPALLPPEPAPFAMLSSPSPASKHSATHLSTSETCQKAGSSQVDGKRRVALPCCVLGALAPARHVVCSSAMDWNGAFLVWRMLAGEQQGMRVAACQTFMLFRTKTRRLWQLTTLLPLGCHKLCVCVHACVYVNVCMICWPSYAWPPNSPPLTPMKSQQVLKRRGVGHTHRKTPSENSHPGNASSQLPQSVPPPPSPDHLQGCCQPGLQAAGTASGHAQLSLPGGAPEMLGKAGGRKTGHPGVKHSKIRQCVTMKILDVVQQQQPTSGNGKPCCQGKQQLEARAWLGNTVMLRTAKDSGSAVRIKGWEGWLLCSEAPGSAATEILAVLGMHNQSYKRRAAFNRKASDDLAAPGRF